MVSIFFSISFLLIFLGTSFIGKWVVSGHTDKSLLRSFQRSESDLLSNYGYKTQKTSVKFGTNYEQFKNIFFSPSIIGSYEDIETNSKASSAKKRQAGDYLDFILDYGITLNKLNQNFNPTDGYKFTFSQELPVYSEDGTLVNKVNYTKYL